MLHKARKHDGIEDGKLFKWTLSRGSLWLWKCLAESTKNPDWAVELAYQRRGPAFSDMASIQFSLDLPVLPYAARIRKSRLSAQTWYA